MTLVAPFGFYGWGNIGDESTLQGFAKLVGLRQPPLPSVWVASRDPRHTERIEPSFKYFSATRKGFRGTWAHYRATAIVFPGGTPIMDGLGAWPLNEVAPLVCAAHDGGVPVVFVGVGTERLNRGESRDVVSKVLATRVNHWTVRSERDRERLTGWGVPPDLVTVAADLAWLLPPVSADFGRKHLDGVLDPGHPLIGINVNNEQVILRRDPAFFEKLAALADHLIESKGARILFFCSEVREGPAYDKAAGGKVLAAMRRPDRATMLPNRYWSPQELLSFIACCRMVVSTRYHVCLFAALQQVPFLALQRSDKVQDLCTDIEWSHGVGLDDLMLDKLIELASDIDDRHTLLTEALRDASVRQARRSFVNQVALDRLAGIEAGWSRL
jgi:polysaccharide pyruvyl transferase WcaK-like protein